MQRLSARPHHVGSPYDQDNAEWILGKFKEFGLDAHIEQFAVLFPTPKQRLVELVDGGLKFTAKLEEPAVPEDPTSHQQSEQLPTYNAYSIDGDVTAPNTRRSEEHTSELQSRLHLVCRLLLEKKKKINQVRSTYFLRITQLCLCPSHS